MTFIRKSGGTNVMPSTVKRRSGSTWVNVQTIKRRLSGAWVTAWTFFTATITGNSHTDTFNPVSSLYTHTGSATVTPSGGSGSYTYSWSSLGGTGTLSGTTTATVGVTSITANPTESILLQCVVSDGTNTTSPTLSYTY